MQQAATRRNARAADARPALAARQTERSPERKPADDPGRRCSSPSQPGTDPSPTPISPVGGRPPDLAAQPRGSGHRFEIADGAAEIMRSRGVEEDQVEPAVDHRARPPGRGATVRRDRDARSRTGSRWCRGTCAAAATVVRKSTAPPRTRYRLSSIAVISGAVMSDRNLGTCRSSRLALANEIFAARQPGDEADPVEQRAVERPVLDPADIVEEEQLARAGSTAAAESTTIEPSPTSPAADPDQRIIAASEAFAAPPSDEQPDRASAAAATSSLELRIIGFELRLADHLADEGRVGGIGLHRKVARQGGPPFRLSARP